MKVIVQRVSEASVSVSGHLVGQIHKGLCVLVGIGNDDTSKDVEYISRKLLNVRLFPHPETKKSWDKNVVQIDGGILLISQFTLCHVFKGNKPDFHNAMPGESAKALFDELTERMRRQYISERIATGQFGSYMDVRIANDGPVTVSFDSRDVGGSGSGERGGTSGS
mmetsp:Transcript_42013/g.48726  ORF Transcript_42013/g.48726 Transcript_42013/m.48726 type:complete len:166 (+) Transcript_42013:62-559(+)